jgi:L-lactate dehydrogenase (cytochrome)
MALSYRTTADDSSTAYSPLLVPCPPIVDAVGDRLTVLADSGIRSGLDVIPMLVFALAARGEAGVSQLLEIMAREMRIGMTLTGARNIAEITNCVLARV